MKKIIVLNNNNEEFYIILHATRDANAEEYGKYQWYLMDEPNSNSEQLIENETYESISFCNNSDWYKNNIGKWLCCHIEYSDDKYDEVFLYLTDNFINMIKSNMFDIVSFSREDGMTETKYISVN